MHAQVKHTLYIANLQDLIPTLARPLIILKKLLSATVNPRLSDPRLTVSSIIWNGIWKFFIQVMSDY